MTSNEIIMIAVGALSGVCVVAYSINKILAFKKLSKEEQKEKVKQWLLIAVTEAEKLFGSKTGEIKLSYVYDLFITKFPAIAKIIKLSDFEIMVNEVLVTFRKTLEESEDLKKYIDKE